MTEPISHDVTYLLRAWSGGDPSALAQVLPLIERELHRIAQNHLRKERANHTLQATALVNEAYLRLAQWNEAQWNNRAHFFCLASRVMRHVLVDYARKNEGRQHVTLEEAVEMAVSPLADIVALDDALKDLEKFDPRKSQIVEMRFFSGMTIEEIADVLKLSVRTVLRDWNMAKAWLLRELDHKGKSDDAGAMATN